MKNWLKWIFIGIGGIFVIILLISVIMKINSNLSFENTVDTSLKKVLELNEFHSYKYNYSSFVTVYYKFDLSTYKQYSEFKNVVKEMKNQISAMDGKPDLNFTKYKKIIDELSVDKGSLFIDYFINFSESMKGFKTVGIDSIKKWKMEESQKNEFVKKIFILMFKLPNMFDVDEYMNSLSKLSGDNLTNFMKGKGTSVYNNDFLKIKDLFYLCDNYSDLSFLSEFLFLKEENVKKQVKYFAAYDGSVRAGIDESIKIEITNEKEHEITIFIPEVKILSCSVDLKADHKNKSVISFDKNAVNSDVFMRESHEAAQKDLSKKVAEDKDLLELAEKNLKSTIESLIKSVIKDKDIKIKYEKIDYTKELSV